ncbi:MAG TPA: sulfotransferase [Candidatus Binataceae bacterium]|jgi:hypothetical protein|nr:sulfotransferase [Candidatus Binataceae bacterium]
MSPGGSWSRPVFNLNLAAWRAIRNRNRAPVARGLALRFCLAGGAFSMLGALQERMYGRALERIEVKSPVFIVGHWRSGTTLLHELLALDERFAAPDNYACFNPHHFLLARHGAPPKRQLVRPTGDIVVSAFSPQEEEFALLCLGATSPYEAFMFPSAMNRLEALSDPDLFEQRERRRWDRAMLWILKATAYVSGAGRRLAVKSPSNSLRIARLNTLFPDASFIRVVREPCAVFSSSLRLWQSMWERYALTPPLGQDALVERVLQAGLALERKLQHGLRGLPEDRAATVRYEDLVADPHGTIERLYQRLMLGNPSSALDKVGRYMDCNSPRPLASADDWKPLVQRRWSALFDEFGYTLN